MIVYTIGMQKGGAGKTTTSGWLVDELGKYGKTILIDADPQGSSSSWLLNEAPNYELADVLYNKVELDKAIVNTSYNFDILSTFGVGGELYNYLENKLSNQPFCFLDVNEKLEQLGYEYVIYDTSPSSGRLERAILYASDNVITPIRPDMFSLDGIEIFANVLINLKKDMRKAPKHSHIIINSYDDRLKQHKIIMSKVKELEGFNIFTVPVDPVFSKAQAINKPINKIFGADKAKKETIKAIENIVQSIITKDN